MFASPGALGGTPDVLPGAWVYGGDFFTTYPVLHET